MIFFFPVLEEELDSASTPPTQHTSQGCEGNEGLRYISPALYHLLANHYHWKTASQSLALSMSELGRAAFITSEAGIKDEAKCTHIHTHTHMDMHKAGHHSVHFIYLSSMCKNVLSGVAIGKMSHGIH